MLEVNIPWLCTLLHMQNIISKSYQSKKLQKYLYARRKLLLPKHVKGMFGEKECCDRELHLDRTHEG